MHTHTQVGHSFRQQTDRHHSSHIEVELVFELKVCESVPAHLGPRAHARPFRTLCWLPMAWTLYSASDWVQKGSGSKHLHVSCGTAQNCGGIKKRKRKFVSYGCLLYEVTQGFYHSTLFGMNLQLPGREPCFWQVYGLPVRRGGERREWPSDSQISVQRKCVSSCTSDPSGQSGTCSLPAWTTNQASVFWLRVYVSLSSVSKKST